MRKKINKGIAFVLGVVVCAVTFLTAVPQMSVEVYADTTNKNLMLGSSMLAPDMTLEPALDVEVGAGTDSSYTITIYPDEKYRVTTAQTVYYGKKGSNALAWYVIGYDGTGAVSESGTTTLFAQNNLSNDLVYYT